MTRFYARSAVTGELEKVQTSAKPDNPAKFLELNKNHVEKYVFESMMKRPMVAVVDGKNEKGEI